MRSTRLLALLIALPLSVMMTSCDFLGALFHPAPEIAFAPYAPGYAAKPDFAQVEYDFPLSPVELKKLTPANIKNYDQEQLDQIYARLTAGPIPDGTYDGGLFFPKGMSGERRIAEIIGGLSGMALDLKAQNLEFLSKFLWKGKVFERAQGLARSRIEDFALLRPMIDGDPNSLPKMSLRGKDQWLLFPARVYCGQSLLDSRRESAIVDYFFNDELPGYRERPDYLMGRRGFQAREELRMVRPGFYLGRVYIGKIFIFNFTLFNRDVSDKESDAFLKTGQVREECWMGTQGKKFVAMAR